MLSIFVLLFGLAIGSFLNVLADRLPNGESLMGRSHCDYCKRILRPIELIPVISFLAQKARSHCCQKSLSFQYPIIEIITSGVFLILFELVYVQKGDLLLTIASLIIASTLIVITVADLKYQIIPDAMLAAIFAAMTALFIFKPGFGDDFVVHFFAGCALSAGMSVLFLATKGKGIGFGDVKFAFIIGYMLGLQNGFLALYFGFIIGGLLAIALLFFKKGTLKSRIAFGPFMVAGILITLIFNDGILHVINSLF